MYRSLDPSDNSLRLWVQIGLNQDGHEAHVDGAPCVELNMIKKDRNKNFFIDFLMKLESTITLRQSPANNKPADLLMFYQSL